MSVRPKRLIDGLNKAAEITCVALLSLLVIVATMQVFYRYVLLQPLVWSEEAARYLLIWLSFAAAGLVLREDGNPRVEIIPVLLPARGRAILELAIRLLTAAFLIVFIWVGWLVALRYLPFASLGTGLSQAVPRFALPVGGALMLVNIIPVVLEDIARLGLGGERR